MKISSLVYILARSVVHPIFVTMVFCICCIAFIFPRFSLIGTDGTFYVLMAESIYHASGFEVFGIQNTIFSPMLPILIQPFLLFFNDSAFAAHVSMMVMGVLSVPLFFWSIKTCISRTYAILTSILYAALGGILWSYSTVITPQIPAAFFSILLFGIIQRYVSEKKGSFLIGALIGTSVSVLYLLRPEYILIMPFLFIFLFVLSSRRPQIVESYGPVKKEYGFKTPPLVRWVYQYRDVCGYIVGFTLCALPYILFLHAQLGEWTFTGRVNEATLVAVGAIYESTDPSTQGPASISAPPPLPGSFSNLVIENIFPISKRLFDGLLNVERNILQTFGLVGVFFLGLGIWQLIAEKKYALLCISGILLLPIIAIALVQGGSPNYLIQYFYIFTFFIGVGLVHFRKSMLTALNLSVTVRKIIWVGVIVFLFGYLFFPVIQRYAFLPPDYTNPELKTMGEWMSLNIHNKNARVFSRKPEVAYYAGMDWMLVPNIEDVEGLVVLMREQNVRYLVVDSLLLTTYPDLAIGFQNDYATDSLKLLHSIQLHGNFSRLYRLE